MKTTMQVEGFKELDNLLKELPTATSKNVLRRAARKALAPVVSTAQSLAPVKRGKLKRSHRIGSKLSRRQAALARKQDAEGKASITMYAGPGPLPSAHLEEFGANGRKARPFMRPAWDQNKDQVLSIFKSEIAAEIDKATKRLARKAARAAAKAATGG